MLVTHIHVGVYISFLKTFAQLKKDGGSILFYTKKNLRKSYYSGTLYITKAGQR